MSFKKNVFVAAVVSTLLSGLVAFVLNGNSVKMLETCYFQMIRKVLGRQACNSVVVGGKQIYKQKSNREICMLLKVPSFVTLLRVHRLQFFQSMLADREGGLREYPQLDWQCSLQSLEALQRGV